jgi:purine-binding chemotaxis protein CheW
MSSDVNETGLSKRGIRQLTTFTLGTNQYGIDVMRVQEVTNSLPMTKIPIAPNYVCGLINLRGQIATAIGLQELFDIKTEKVEETKMTVICRVDGALLSLLVDSIGDVIEVPDTDFEPVPDTIKGKVRSFMGGVYKTKGAIISVIDLDKLNGELNQPNIQSNIA